MVAEINEFPPSNNISELDDFLLNNSPFGSIGANKNNTSCPNSKEVTPKEGEIK